MVPNSRALKNMQNHKINRVLEVHGYAITEPSGPHGRWQTYVRKEGEARKIVRASSYDKLIGKLYEIYFSQRSFSSMTMDTLFQEWLSYKECITDSMKTIRRHEQHWNKYFSSIRRKKLSCYDCLELQKECNLLVKEYHLSSKEWQNVKTILTGMFRYAYDKGYLSENIMRDVKITVKFRQVNKKSGKTETYQTEELKRLFHYLDEEFSNTGDFVLLAIKFDFFVGCRVGELVSLKWCDLLDLNHLHICREEIKESQRIDGVWKDFYAVVGHTKTHTDRIVLLVPEAIGILNYIRLETGGNPSPDHFIFVRNHERITSRQVNYALEKACSKLDIPVKRSHKIRKTFASLLASGNVPLDCIREILGHSNLSTTLGYIYNPLSEKETYSLMSKAL